MAGGKARPKKDKALKVSEGQAVTVGTIVVRGVPSYKAGMNVKGLGTLYAVRAGKVHFSRRKTATGAYHTYVNVVS
jgi:ribosomal protein L27